MSGPRVTDHALLRFLERAGGLEVERLRAKLAASLASAHAAVGAIGGGDYLILSGGMIYVVKDAAVVTVIPEDDHVSRGLHAKLLRHPDR